MPDLTPDLVAEQNQAVEYGTYRANKSIYIGTARAFNEGDPVPVSHVDRGVVSADDVDPTSTPAKASEPKPKPDVPTTPKEG